jgi:hypothetical protein
VISPFKIAAAVLGVRFSVLVTLRLNTRFADSTASGTLANGLQMDSAGVVGETTKSGMPLATVVKVISGKGETQTEGKVVCHCETGSAISAGFEIVTSPVTQV